MKVLVTGGAGYIGSHTAIFSDVSTSPIDFVRVETNSIMQQVTTKATIKKNTT